jgi:hypothetical protein
MLSQKYLLQYEETMIWADNKPTEPAMPIPEANVSSGPYAAAMGTFTGMKWTHAEWNP